MRSFFAKQQWVLAFFVVVSCAYAGQNPPQAAIVEPIATSAVHLYPFRSAVNGKIGYINESGNVKIVPNLNDCGGINPGPEFSEGYAITGCVPLGYIDVSGKMSITPEFDEVKAFSQGLAAAKKENGKWGYIGKDGKFVIAPQFQEAENFSEGLAAVANNDGEWGYIDLSGQVRISCRFEKAGDFSRYVQDPFHFEKAGGFLEALAPVQVDGKFGYVDKTGKLVIPPQFKNAKSFHEGLAAVLLEKGWQYIGSNGKPAFSAQYEDAGEFSQGLAPVLQQKNGAYGYIDRYGTFRIQPKFEHAFPFKGNLALVYFERRSNPQIEDRHSLLYGYIDKNEHRVFSAEIPYIQTFGFRSIGDREQAAQIPMSAITIESVPVGAKVYLVPLDDWESDKNVENDREKLLQYLQSEYTPLRNYEVIQQVYRVLLELSGKRIARLFDVNEHNTRYLQVDFQKEQ